MKAHIKAGTSGTFCGANIRTTSGFGVSNEQFKALSPSFRCKKCEKKLLASTPAIEMASEAFEEYAKDNLLTPMDAAEFVKSLTEL
jgi:hypothetical protein